MREHRGEALAKRDEEALPVVLPHWCKERKRSLHCTWQHRNQRIRGDDGTDRQTREERDGRANRAEACVHLIGEEHRNESRVDTGERADRWEPLGVQRAERAHRDQAADESHKRVRDRASEGGEAEEDAEVGDRNPHAEAERRVKPVRRRRAETAAEVEWRVGRRRNDVRWPVRRAEARKADKQTHVERCQEHPNDAATVEITVSGGVGYIRIRLRRTSARRGIPSGLCHGPDIGSADAKSPSEK